VRRPPQFSRFFGTDFAVALPGRVMARQLEGAAKAGFNHDGGDFWRLLLESDRAEYTRMLRASIEYLADHPDPLTVQGMAKTPEQQNRVQKAWRKLVMGLVNADKEHSNV
jgi:hypothetical protein